MKRVRKLLKRKTLVTGSNPRYQQSASDPGSNLVTSSRTLDFPDGVKIWHECDDAKVDLCFIHGLTGDRESTWTAPGQSVPWPKSLLPSELKDVRILTYGYDAYVTRKSVASSNRLIDHATNLLHDLTTDRERHDASTRPIIFVAHSLGGLVFKLAILRSRNNSELHLRSIFDSTQGIMFLGTPHRGSWIADWATIPVSLFGLMKSTNKMLLDVLQTDDQLLESIRVDFSGMLRELPTRGRRLEVACFFEELPIFANRKVVSKDSASFDSYEPISIHANHSNMVKFATAEENGFKRFLGVLVRWEKQADAVKTLIESVSIASLQACLQSLAFANMSDRLHDIDYAAQGTCRWLMQHQMFDKWKRSRQGLLWIKGNPGSGKSTLLKFLLSQYRDTSNVKNNNIILSFFFHGRGDELQRTPLGFFRSFLHQLLSATPTTFTDLTKLFEKKKAEIGKPNRDWRWQERELQRILESSLPRVSEFHSILRWLMSLLYNGSALRSQAHICVTCRHYPILDHGGELEICTERENEDDISSYVESQLSTSLELSSSPIPDLIKARANGIFLWARLVVDNTLQLDREGVALTTIEDKIYSTPSKLTDLYHDIVKGMVPGSLKLIQWMCFSRRLLSMNEVRWALILDTNTPHASTKHYEESPEFIKADDRMMRHIKSVSCGLVEVTLSSNIQTVQFIHQTVKEFFISRGLLALDKSSQSVDEAIGRAHFRLSRTCICYLRIDNISHLLHEIGIRIHEQSFPFLEYSATSWFEHMQQSDVKGIPQDDILQIFAWDSSSDLEVWVTAFGAVTSTYTATQFARRTTLIHIAASYQIMGLLKLILQKMNPRPDELDLMDSDSRTPLSWAAQQGCEAAVQALLGHGANTELCDELGLTPLMLAARHGSIVVARHLLDHNASAKVRDNLDRTALYWAAEKGHTDIVRLLLDESGFVDSQDFYGQTPLFGAAGNSNPATAELLLGSGAWIDQADFNGLTPLSRAARLGCPETVKLLLDHGADSEATTLEGWTPLFWAIESEHEITIRLLLERDANIEARDFSGKTPLFLAVIQQREVGTQLLLEAGASVEATDRIGQTPLFQAVWAGNVGIIRLLLDQGADVDARDESGSTPLFQAFRSKRKAVILQLLERGASVLTLDNQGRTPLSIASASMRHIVKDIVASLPEKPS